MGSIPKYQILVNWVKEKVGKNELKAGDKLEPEYKLCSEFKMSRQTVRHALSILEHEGIIRCRQGSGNYINSVCQGKKRDGNGNVMIVSTYLNGYIFPNIIEGMERVLNREGYGVQMAFTHNKVEQEGMVLTGILEQNDIEGVIIEPTKSGLPNPNIHIYQELISRRIPVLFYNSFYPGVQLAHVSLDDKKAGYLAARHLLDCGHTKIGGIFKSDDGQGHLRYQGYVNALMEVGIRLREETIIWIDSEDQKTIVRDDRRILRRLKGCTACICYNDNVAFDLERICIRHEIQIPEQLSIVSFDNSEQAELCDVPVTSIMHPLERLGEKAADNLISLIRNYEYDANYEFEPDICIRSSVNVICDERNTL